MVKPSLSTLFRSPKIFFVRFNVQSFPKLTPSQPEVIFLNKFFKKLILFMSPFLVLVMVFEKAGGLVLEEDLLFVGEDQGEEVPVLLALHRRIHTIWLMSIFFERV